MTVQEAIKNLEEERDSLCELMKFPVMKTNSKAICKRIDAIARAVIALENQNKIEHVLTKLKDEIMSRTDVAILTTDVFVDGQASGLERALEIIEEVMNV